MSTSSEQEPTAAAEGEKLDKGQMHSSLKWTTISQILSKGFRFATQVVLAWILAKEVIGLMAIVMAAIYTMIALREVGFGQAFIQRHDKDEAEAELAANTTFVITLVANAALFALTFALTPWLISFFGESDGLNAVPVLRITLLSFFIDTVLTTAGFVLQKRLNFSAISIAEIVGSLAYGVIAIGLAWLGYGIWSLVISLLVSTALQAAMMLKSAAWLPRLQFDRQIAKELFSFGKHLWALAVLSAAGQSFPRFVIGGEYGYAKTGAYSYAFNLCNLPASQISSLVNRIAFPALSKIKHDIPQMQQVFMKALSHVSMLSLPVAFGFLAISENFVLTVYGEKWEDCIEIINVLAFFGMSLSISSVAAPVIMAVGKPKLMLYTSILHHAILFPLLFWLVKFGSVGVAIAELVPMLSSSTIAFLIVNKYLHLPLRKFMVPLSRSLLSAFLMYLATVSYQTSVADILSRPLSLASSICVGGLSYLAFSWLLNRELCLEFWQTIRGVAGSKMSTRS